MSSPFDAASAGHESRFCDFAEIQDSPEFRSLKSLHHRFVFPVTVAALGGYGAYITLAAFAHSFMSITVLGNITMGLVLGFLQIIMTFVVTLTYVAYANRVLDPRSSRLRADLPVVHYVPATQSFVRSDIAEDVR